MCLTLWAVTVAIECCTELLCVLHWVVKHLCSCQQSGCLTRGINWKAEFKTPCSNINVFVCVNLCAHDFVLIFKVSMCVTDGFKCGSSIAPHTNMFDCLFAETHGFWYRLKQPSRGWLAVVERGKITQSFRRERVCKFAGKKRRFYNSGKTGNL